MELPKVNLNDIPWSTCECGGKAFVSASMIKVVSKLLSGAAKDQMNEVPVLLCVDCNKVPKFIHQDSEMFPSSMKAQSPSAI